MKWVLMQLSHLFRLCIVFKYFGRCVILELRFMKVRIKDIAKKLNVSESTVSRALSDHPRISETTKLRVNAAAKELNYRPNLVAKSLKLKSTNTYGLYLPFRSFIFSV